MLKLNRYGIILFLTGFAALTYEIVFLKTLSLFIGQSIYAFSAMLAAFMFGIGIGSIYSARLKREALWLFSLTQLGIAAYSIFFIPLLNKTNIPVYLISQLPFYLQSVSLIMLSLAILIIPTSLMGLSFPLLLRHVMEEKYDKNKIGQLFAYNTIGGLLGSLAAGFIFLPKYGVSGTLIIAAVINLTVALSIKTRHFSKRIATSVILLLIFLSFNPAIDHFAVGLFYNISKYNSLEDFTSNIEEVRKNSEILYSDFDVYGHTLVLKTRQSKILHINGKPDGGTSGDVTTELMTGYIPMLLHKNPKKVAVIGLGTGLTVGATLQFDAERVDVYEINPGVVEANEYFKEENHHALSNLRTRLIMGDARRNLKLSEEIYDVIISEPSNPWVEGEGFLFTKEYYEIVDERLGETGIFLQWIGAYDYTEEAFNILMNTLHTTFSHIQIWSDGSDFYIISSREPKTFNYAKTHKKINEPVIKADLELIGLFEGKEIKPVDIFFSHFIKHHEKTEETKINTDDNSIIEFSTGRFKGKIINHVKRLVENQTRVLPISLTKDDFDIEFESTLPFYESKYLTTQFDAAFVINKQIIFKDDVNTLFIQTQIQTEPPTLAQANELAANFNATAIDSEKYLYSFKGEKAHGVIGYCPEVQKSFVAYSTAKTPIEINCKKHSEE